MTPYGITVDKTHYGRIIGELRAERDIARARLARACFQRDALLFVVAGLLFGIVIWRWF